MQSGKVFMMETPYLESILLHPYVVEVKTSLKSPIDITRPPVTERLPFKLVKKSHGEQHDQKGSINLICVPTMFYDDASKSYKQALETLDFTPIPLKAAVNEHVNYVLAKREANFTSDPIQYIA
jgi:hypothetical protein